jgi:hypothetical protein
MTEGELTGEIPSSDGLFLELALFGFLSMLFYAFVLCTLFILPWAWFAVTSLALIHNADVIGV